MAVIARYELRVEGLVSGDPASNAAWIDLFKLTIGPPPNQAQGELGSPVGWSDGFLLKGYKEYIWEREGYEHAHMADHTVLSFHAEVAGFFGGSSHAPATQAQAPKDYAWFLTHNAQKWCADLMARLATLNAKLSAAGKLVEHVHMRRFHWYIGNGGG